MHAELEAQLRAAPDDEAAWLVYADWLLEHGDPRGRLIHTRRELSREERRRWAGAAEPYARIQHGFVTALELPTTALHVLAPLLAAPLLGSLVIRPPGDGDDGQDDLSVEDPLRLVLALDLRRLHTLALRYHDLTDEHLAALAGARLAITELDLRYTGLTDARLAALAAAPWFAGVRRLHLQGNPLTDASVAWLRGREHVDLRDTGITAVDGSSRVVVHGAPPATRARPPCPAPARLAEGLALSPQRTARFTSPRIFDKRSLSRTFTKDCERVAGWPNFIVVYVDPDEWTFRTYEHILPLDRLFDAPALTLDDHVELAHEVHRFALRGELPDLDALPLYTAPLNAGTRGGKRYIFHAAPLAEALTRAIRTALPELRGFSHVNPVFRCNRFEPGDEPFRRHLDTPYHDPARRQLSRYTLLIYLTDGTGTPALQIEDLAITAIEARQCFVFHQAYEHAGAAFTASRKVFLRSELVFDEPDTLHDPRIAALFSKACYLTGESIRDAELVRDADRAYHGVAAAHWTSVLPRSSAPFVHKQLGAFHWLANGYDFWFPRALPLPDCATLVLLDYFNATLAGEPLRAQVTATTLRDLDPEAFVRALPAPPMFPVLDKDALFPRPEAVGRACCPGHASRGWIAARSPEVVELYERAQRFARTRIDPAPIAILGEEVFLDPSRFAISGNQIHVLSSARLAPVNFAACWNCLASPPNFVDVEREVGVLQPLVPPILWEATPATHHLMFDFFRNGWTIAHQRIPVPRVRELDPAQPADMPWLDASDALAIAPPASTELRLPFWGDSPLVRELYADRRSRR